ncbi:F-box/LRR-repeat protein At3g26922-like [Salvia miltiorrhiza]|uniref:F-box/LRR-repeat protein At3g26922-like n=1 Tax=Salvia miltiorrhiza TaxID=226208 RepID=UPI0025ACE810|nr:F-box/LRR-repeat protein At3g26922-like [Salvia miltiorrhiza]XP_057808136.1 F-box/LRR-repeat protein At3g26922-like [Salvia miltiorrhiza]
MDVKYFKSDSDFLAKEWCYRRCNGGVDRISELPDEIILGILSFLSLRECVTTSVLSSRWSDLWKHTPNLNLNAKLLTNHYQEPIQGHAWDAERCKYIEIVNSILQSHKAPSLKEFRISLYANKSAQCAVAKWLEFVLSRHVERLILDLVCDDTRNSVSTYAVSLEELLRDRPQDLIGFKSLKSLRLKGFRVSGEAIDSFLCNCPLLEQLYIHGSFLTSDVVVCGTALRLKLFHIDNCYGSSENSIKVSAPNLTWLGVCATLKLILENIPKLTRAYYTCPFPRPDYTKQFASSVFSCVSRLQNLNLNLCSTKVFLPNAIPQMPNLKKLAVGYDGVAYEPVLQPVTALIRASPRLQELKLQVARPGRSHTTCKSGERHRHRHLKVFEFIGFFEREGDHIELLKYVLDNCAALEKIILNCSSWSRFVYKLEAQPRAARDRLEQLLDGKVDDRIQLYITPSVRQK